MSSQELVNNLREELVSDEFRVLVVGDNDTGDTLGAAVDVKGVCCGGVLVVQIKDLS